MIFIDSRSGGVAIAQPPADFCYPSQIKTRAAGSKRKANAAGLRLAEKILYALPFRYRISDGRGGTAEGSVTLQVQPVNDAPVSLENSFKVLQGSTLETATGVLSNDLDIENSPLVAILVAPPTRGVIAFRVD